MKGFNAFGEYAFEFLAVTVLMGLSAVTVLPFVPMLVGVTGYFSRPMGERRFKDIFVTMRDNAKIIALYTVFQLVILIFPVLNIYYFNFHPQNTNAFVLAVSCIALVACVIYLVAAPTIIINMNVTFFQLLRNSFMLIFGGLLRSILGALCFAGVVALILYYPYVIIFTLYAVPLAVSYLMRENMYVLKAKTLNTSVYELKKARRTDDYLDEYGNINRNKTENKDEKK